MYPQIIPHQNEGDRKLINCDCLVDKEFPRHREEQTNNDLVLVQHLHLTARFSFCFATFAMPDSVVAPSSAAIKGEAPSSSNGDANEDDQTAAFDRVTARGVDGGLFQASMQAIRGSHVQSNRLRAGLVVAGMFTDKEIYKEVISLFYVFNKEMEQKLLQLQKEKKDDIATKLLNLGYDFTEAWEKDLDFLYTSETWKDEVDQLVAQNAIAQDYRDTIRAMTTGAQVAGAAFCLWGGLVIGGGAIAMPRVKALCGPDALHIYELVTGPGRQARKMAFIETWDSLAPTDSHDFDQVVAFARQCMQRNNDVFASLQRKPWWWKYVVSVNVALVAAVVAWFMNGRFF